MKYTSALILTLVAALLHTSCAYPQPNVDAQASGNIFSDIFHGFGDLARDVAENFHAAKESGVETANHFLEDLKNATDVFIAEAEQYADAIGDTLRSLVRESVTKFSATVRAFHAKLQERIQSLANTEKVRVLRSIDRHLIALNSSAVRLQQTVLHVRNDINEKIIKQEQRVQREWNSWASSQLERVAVQTNSNENAVQQAEEIINEYVNRYSNLLSHCADEQEVELQDYESHVISTISSHQNALEQLIAEIEACLASDDSRESNAQCRRNVKAALAELLSAPGDVLQLAIEGGKLAAADFSRRACVLQTLVEFKLGTVHVQLKLRKIISDANRGESIDASIGESNSESDSASNSESDSASDSESDSASNSESNSESDSASNSESNSESDSASNSESDSASNSESDSASNSESDSESDSASNSESDSESDSASNSESDSASNSESDSASDSESDSASNSESDSASDSESNNSSDNRHSRGNGKSNSASHSKGNSKSNSANNKHGKGDRKNDSDNSSASNESADNSDSSSNESRN